MSDKSDIAALYELLSLENWAIWGITQKTVSPSLTNVPYSIICLRNAAVSGWYLEMKRFSSTCCIDS
jgi:hypothetical protein